MSGIGMLGSVNISLQDSYGSIDVDSLTSIPVITENLNFAIGQLVEENMYQRFGESPSHEGAHQIDGSINCQPEPESFGWLLKAVCGQASVISDTNLQTHKFRPLDTSDFDERASLPPFTILTDRDVASGMAYVSCLANQLSLEAANSELLTANVDWIGASYQDAANAAPVFSDKAPWAWNTASVSFNGVGNAELRSFTLNHANNLESIYTLTSSKSPHKIKRTAQVNISGTMVLDFVSNSLMAEFIAQNEQQLIVTFLSDVQSPAQLKIDLPKCRITEYQTGIGGAGLQQLTANFVGKYDTTSSYQLEYTLINTIAGYPTPAS